MISTKSAISILGRTQKKEGKNKRKNKTKIELVELLLFFFFLSFFSIKKQEGEVDLEAVYNETEETIKNYLCIQIIGKEISMPILCSTMQSKI